MNLDFDSFDGLVFDMDGTLVDTMPTHFRAWSESMRRHGLKLSEDRFYALGGVPAGAIIKQLAEEQAQIVDAEQIAEEKEALFLDLLDEVRPVAPVYAIALAYHGKRPLAVATGSPRWVANRLLDALDCLDWFGAIVTSDDVQNPKPHPETYLKAAAGIGVAPEKCHAFEDTALGLEAATRAGMTAVDIHTLL